MLYVPLHHHAHLIMFECSETCELGRYHHGNQEVLPEKEAKAEGEDDLSERFYNSRP